MKTFSLAALFTLLVTPATFAQLVLENGADIDMNGSTGSQIIFPDGTMMDSALESGLSLPAGHGGTSNTVSGTDAYVGGGANNLASAENSVISGGQQNNVTDDFGTIGGGYANQAGDSAGDTTDATHATVAGGQNNEATATGAAVAGGYFNIVTGSYANIGGGYFNTASGSRSAVAGGFNNDASGYGATIGGGGSNLSSGANAVVAGGSSNAASGNNSAVTGGEFNEATGAHSFAAGRNAKANHAGTFVWSDNTGTNFTSSAEKTFLARASNGFAFYTKGDLSLGAELAMDATAWSTLSDRNAKENIIEIDVEHALEKLAAIPVVQFNYKGVDPEQKHIGIMAQDFHAAFDVAGNPLRISTQDIDGVALAAIQGLYHQLLKERQRNDQLEARIAAIEQILRN